MGRTDSSASRRTSAAWLLAALAIALSVSAMCAVLVAQTPRSAARPKLYRKSVPPPASWDQATLDAFFEDARTKLGPEPPKSQLNSASNSSQPSPGDPSKPAQGERWSELITAETLEDEIKSLAPQLSSTVKAASDFKAGKYLDARRNLSELAVLFAVIGRYDAPVRWEDAAADLQSQFSRAGFNCKAASDATWDEARDRADLLTRVIRGERPVPAASTPGVEDWSQVADRVPLMQRMEESHRDRLKPWLADAGRFSRHKDDIAREAQLLTVFARVIQSPGYEFADDETYRSHAAELEAQARELARAAEEGDFARAQPLAGKISQTCDACHGGFRS